MERNGANIGEGQNFEYFERLCIPLYAYAKCPHQI